MPFFNGKQLVIAGGNKAGPIALTHDDEKAKVFGGSYFGGGEQAAPTPQAQPTAQPTAPSAPASTPAPVVKLPDPQQPQAEPTKLPETPAAPPVLNNHPAAPTTSQPAQPTSSPAQPGSGQMATDLYARATAAMDNPSRYNADLVKAGAKVIEDTIARMRQTGTRNVGEWAASRGLVGSSLEGERMTDLEGELDRSGREQLFNLQRDQATTFANDRDSAFGQGLGAAGLASSNYFNNAQVDYQNKALGQNQSQFDANMGYQNKALDQSKYFQQGQLDNQREGLTQNKAAFFADLMSRYPGLDLTQFGYPKPQTPAGGQPNAPGTEGQSVLVDGVRWTWRGGQWVNG